MTSGVYPRTSSNRQGRKPILSNEQVAKVAELLTKGYKVRYLSVQLGVCETTLQRALRRFKEQA
jgi:IS30 family transposase